MKKLKNKQAINYDKYILCPIIYNTINGIINSIDQEEDKKYIFNNLNELDNKQIYLLTKAIIGYTLNIKDFYYMCDILKTFIKREKIIMIRKKIVENFELIVSLKMAIYNILKNKNDFNRNKIIKLFNNYGLNREDINIYFWLDELGLYNDAKKQLSKIKQDIVHPKEVVKKATILIEKLKEENYIEKCVNKKMRFILKSNNYLTLEDIVNDKIISAISTYYKYYPFADSLHLTNKVKSNIHDRVINEIYKYTAKKRANMEDKTHTIIISSMYKNNKEGDEYEDFKMYEKNIDHEKSMIINIHAKNYINNINNIKNNKEKNLIIVLLKKNTKDFISYVNENEDIDFFSIEEIHDHFGTDNFFFYLKSFLNINDVKFNKYLKNLRTSFKDEELDDIKTYLY